MNIKLPFRYNKFELDIFNKNDIRMTPYDLEHGDSVDVDLTCKGLWICGHTSSITWTANSIKVF